jgi:hypothetical protein
MRRERKAEWQFSSFFLFRHAPAFRNKRQELVELIAQKLNRVKLAETVVVTDVEFFAIRVRTFPVVFDVRPA